MTTIHRIQVGWSGAPVVGPGLSTFYTSTTPEAPNILAALNAFFTGVGGQVVSGVQWSIPSSGDSFEAETGSLTGEWSAPGGGSTVLSSGSAGFVQGTGARIRWRTGGFTSSGRIVGTTFIVPIPTNSFEGAAALTATCIADLQDAADALVAAATPTLRIWHRPSAAAPAGGSSEEVLSASVPDAVSWLRSRRT